MFGQAEDERARLLLIFQVSNPKIAAGVALVSPSSLASSRLVPCLDQFADLALRETELATDPAVVESALMRRLAAVPERRSACGLRHPLVVILTLTACATLVVGGDSVAAIWQWAARTSQAVLERLGAYPDPFTGLFVVPSERTFRRVLADLDSDALDTAISGYVAEVVRRAAPAPRIPHTPGPVEREQRRAVQRQVTHPAPAGLLPGAALDGKACRGARTEQGGRVFLVGAISHEHGVILGQCQVADKRGEGPAARALPARLNVAGTVLTLDALHTTKATARLITQHLDAHYILIVKGNQCATRRSDASPPGAGQTRREVCWVRWLTRSRKAKGTRACQETGGRVQVPGTARRGTRAVWRRLDCLNPNLQRQHFTATGTAPETGARRGRGVLVRPGHPSRRERCPMRAFKEMSGAPGLR
ncbi:transposase family protein [Streptosporangium sp. NPDC002544]|uniref:transposase family protein n=1 Tax=Streptosporangium sp. NPDC002544 TaxID=3154538 RepID=UPI00331F96C4